MASDKTTVSVLDEVPWSDGITHYDEAHLSVYLRLLDAVADGASDNEMAQAVLGINSAREPERARKVLASHLQRAKWMAEHGYRRLTGD